MNEASSTESQPSGNSAGTLTWPVDQVERWAIQRLVPYARNARTHSPGQVDQIAASIREWGWTNPVLVDEQGTIIAGHGRVLAARKLQHPRCAGHDRGGMDRGAEESLHHC